MEKELSFIVVFTLVSVMIIAFMTADVAKTLGHDVDEKRFAPILEAVEKIQDRIFTLFPTVSCTPESVDLTVVSLERLRLPLDAILELAIRKVVLPPTMPWNLIFGRHILLDRYVGFVEVKQLNVKSGKVVHEIPFKTLQAEHDLGLKFNITLFTIRLSAPAIKGCKEIEFSLSISNAPEQMPMVFIPSEAEAPPIISSFVRAIAECKTFGCIHSIIDKGFIDSVPIFQYFPTTTKITFDLSEGPVQAYKILVLPIPVYDMNLIEKGTYSYELAVVDPVTGSAVKTIPITLVIK